MNKTLWALALGATLACTQTQAATPNRPLVNLVGSTTGLTGLLDLSGTGALIGPLFNGPVSGTVALVGGVVNTGVILVSPLVSPLLNPLTPGDAGLIRTYVNPVFTLVGGLATQPVQTLLHPPLPGLR